MQIGLFGGTFNPVHLGHLKVAQEVKQRFDLETIHIIPSAIPPHKKKEKMVDAADRIEMARLVFKSEEGFPVSDIELRRQGPSYTIDTVLYFKSSISTDIAPYLIMGVDAFLEIDTWMAFKSLFSYVPFIVMSRPGKGIQGNDMVHEVEAVIKTHISDKYVFSEPRQCYYHDIYFPIHVLNVTPIDISSTHIRECIKRGMPIDDMVPESVKQYIEKKGLYL